MVFKHHFFPHVYFHFWAFFLLRYSFLASSALLASPYKYCWLIACESAMPCFLCIQKCSCTEGSWESHILRERKKSWEVNENFGKSCVSGTPSHVPTVITFSLRLPLCSLSLLFSHYMIHFEMLPIFTFQMQVSSFGWNYRTVPSFNKYFLSMFADDMIYAESYRESTKNYYN